MLVRTFLNLLDDILPIIMQEGYDVQINDTREKHDLVFDKVTDDYWGDAEWPRTYSRGQKIV